MRWLEPGNPFLVLALLLGGIICGGYATLDSLTADLKTLRLYEERNGDLRFSASSDGPFVVTHLIRVEPGRGRTAVAALPEPIAIAESGGKILSRAQIARLRWIDNYSQPMTEFLPDSRFEAIYHRPLVAKPK